MLKLGRRPRGHFVTLIEIRVHLIGHFRLLFASGSKRVLVLNRSNDNEFVCMKIHPLIAICMVVHQDSL